MAEVSTWADKIKGGNSPDSVLNAWRDGNRVIPDGESSARHHLHHYTNSAFQETNYSAEYQWTNPTTSCIHEGLHIDSEVKGA